MKNIIRVTAFVLVALFAASCLAACSEKKPAAQPITAQEAYEHANAVSNFGNMTLVPTRDYAELYGIDCHNLEEFIWYTSDNPSLNADEICVIRVKKEKEAYLDVLVSLLQKHIDTRLNVARSYSPEEAAKLEQARIVTVINGTGIWAYFCVGSEYTKMMSSFRKDIG